MSTVATLLRKELLLERRTKETVPAMAIFAATTYVIFHFGLNRGSLEGDLASGVLLVTLLFAAMLGINRLFVSEREQGGFDGFLLAPVDRSALLLAKAAALVLYLAALEVVAVPAFAVLLLGPSPSAGRWLQLAGVLLLTDIGLAVVGTLAAGLAIQTRARDLIAPLVALPLLIPVVIAAARAVAPLLSEVADPVPLKWVGVLSLYDAVFGLLAYAVFDFLLEE